MRRLGRRLTGSVRVRVTATALLAVACALTVAAVVIRFHLEHDRQHILLDTAQQDARVVMAFNPTLSTPLVLPANPTIDSGLIQVVEGSRVLGASRPLRHLPPLWQTGQPRISPASDDFETLAKDVQQVSVPVAGGKADVVVVASMEQFDHTVADVQRLLELGSPMLLAVVGVICWLIIGRALRPIEMMRREVAGLETLPSGQHLLRVAEPAHDDEVGRLARTLNSMLDRMEASSRRERRFVSDASHELRSPIANIRTELEVALHHPATSDWRQVANEVLTQNRRMEELVAGLLLLARSDEGSLIEASEPTDLAAVVESAVGELPPGPPAVRTSTRPAPVRVPAVYTERIVSNLLDNARRFATSSVTVEVSTSVEKAGMVAVLTVADDGPGVPEGDRERIFERFVRLDEARGRSDGGFGLGLAIVADLSRFYGGSIRVEPSREGARFVLRLPAAGVVRPGGGPASGSASADVPSEPASASPPPSIPSTALVGPPPP